MTRIFYNHKWTPKTKISKSAVVTAKPAVVTAKPAVATARPKVSTGGLVNNKRESAGNVVKASARWEWKPKGINTSVNPNGVSMTFYRYNYIDTRGKSKSIVDWVSKRN